MSTVKSLILFLILASLQYTLNLILKELRELKIYIIKKDNIRKN